ncbi:hypothetical protein AAFF_G00201300 [Aldrovandia affinis]|uniref:Secreted protein n=1 Tax=Aldrovandia affinis TaxID=143900 RepID=A0AAD7SWN5_9TELE|nr:hypothetical protein AAFF_G00201300 [Aldrovandia affinis]
MWSPTTLGGRRLSLGLWVEAMLCLSLPRSTWRGEVGAFPELSDSLLVNVSGEIGQKIGLTCLERCNRVASGHIHFLHERRHDFEGTLVFLVASPVTDWDNRDRRRQPRAMTKEPTTRGILQIHTIRGKT